MLQSVCIKIDYMYLINLIHCQTKKQNKTKKLRTINMKDNSTYSTDYEGIMLYLRLYKQEKNAYFKIFRHLAKRKKTSKPPP